MPDLNAEQLAFIMRVLKHTVMPRPDWKAIAEEEGISRADNATTKFRNYLKIIGYNYVNNQFVEADGSGEAVGSEPAKDSPKKRKSPTKKGANGETTNKKRKGSQPSESTANVEEKTEVADETV